MIVYANNNLKKEVERIWRISFPDDSYDFTDFYFRTKYKNENTLIWMENGKAAACLQMLPYTFTYYNQLIPIAYISGAATLPEFRNKGIMKKLLTHAYYEMLKKDIPLSILIPQEPWLVDFYERLGYTNSFMYTSEKFQTKNTYEPCDTYSIEEINDDNKHDAYRFYASYFIKENLCLQKSKNDFDALIELYQLEKGRIFLALSQQNIHGICFANPIDNQIIVKDCVGTHAKVKSSLLQHVAITYFPKEINIQSEGNNEKNNITKGMARIIDVEKMLKFFANAHKNLTFEFNLQDPQLIENQARYRIENGVYKKAAIETNFDSNRENTININLLTRLLLGYKINDLDAVYHHFPCKYPYMSLMMD